MYCPCRLRQCYKKLTRKYETETYSVKNTFDARADVVGFRSVRLNILFKEEKSLSECLQDKATLEQCEAVIDDLSVQHLFKDQDKKGILKKVFSKLLPMQNYGSSAVLKVKLNILLKRIPPHKL